MVTIRGNNIKLFPTQFFFNVSIAEARKTSIEEENGRYYTAIYFESVFIP